MSRRFPVCQNLLFIAMVLGSAAVKVNAAEFNFRTEEIEKAFDLDEQLRNVDAIFARVFETKTVGATPVAP